MFVFLGPICEIFSGLVNAFTELPENVLLADFIKSTVGTGRVEGFAPFMTPVT